MATSKAVVAGIGIIVVIVIIAGVILLMGNNSLTVPPSNITTSVASTSGNNATTSVIQTTVKANNLSTVTTTISGNNTIYLTQSQLKGLVGNGNYTVTSFNALEIANQISASNGSNYQFLKNATREWDVSYNSTVGSKGINREIIFESQTPKVILKFFTTVSGTSGSSINFNVTNVTSNGLTYDYASSDSYFNSTIFVGYMGNYTVYFSSFGNIVSQSKLAAEISGNLH